MSTNTQAKVDWLYSTLAEKGVLPEFAQADNRHTLEPRLRVALEEMFTHFEWHPDKVVSLRDVLITLVAHVRQQCQRLRRETGK